MTSKQIEGTARVDASFDEHGDEYGFLILALAQLVSIFAFWFGSWPRSFGLPERLGLGFALFFFGSGVVGFYLSFRVLSRV